MEAFLGKITQHAMSYAIRSSIGLTATFAINQTSRLLKESLLASRKPLSWTNSPSQTVDNNNNRQELQRLQERLDGKIRIISPAIDMIELISARGNTTLESAVTLTKAIRWDIQSLGIRLEKAAAAEELSRKNRNRAKSQAAHELEICNIIKDIQNLLARIEDAVPLINLAITTSGASLSTSLPKTVSPSRLLQASTFVTAGDTQYSMNRGIPTQVGPAFTLSLYMLFTGHSNRIHEGSENLREATWKEVIHKARVKILRTPFDQTTKTLGHSARDAYSSTPVMESHERADPTAFPSGSKATEYLYHIEVIEDLDDDRLHSFEDEDVQPGPYGDVPLAGIRELIPMYQIDRIFYADTGKILNIGIQGETNNPVLLLKRAINARPPYKMMQEGEKRNGFSVGHDGPEEPDEINVPEEEDSDTQDDVDQQIQRESTVVLPVDIVEAEEEPVEEERAWPFPPDLDPEWLALEVYTEEAEESSSEDEQERESGLDDSAYVSHRPSSSGEQQQQPSSGENLAAGLAALKLSQKSPTPSPSPSTSTSPYPPPHLTTTPKFSSTTSPNPISTSDPPITHAPPYGPIRSSLSLLEMLIRLTSLQLFQQTSHLSIPDELLTFFLEESSTTGAAGADSEMRRRTRWEARMKVGFDPYDDSPIKRRGEEWQYQQHQQHQDQEEREGGGEGEARYWDGDGARERYERGNTLIYEEYEHYPSESGVRAVPWSTPAPNRSSPPAPHNPEYHHRYPSRNSRNQTPNLAPTPEPWLGSGELPSSGPRHIPISSSPMSPYRPIRKSKPTRARSLPLQGVKMDGGGRKGKSGRREMGVGGGRVRESPLGRGVSVETDSSLGTSPGSPTVVGKGKGRDMEES